MEYLPADGGSFNLLTEYCPSLKSSIKFTLLGAAVAQSVEQFIRNEKVTSSIPVSGTKKIKPD